MQETNALHCHANSLKISHPVCGKWRKTYLKRTHRSTMLQIVVVTGKNYKNPTPWWENSKII
ncbi:MAG: hypothetical protein IKC52_00430 [Clostridia bacterium]|nr:hypothetical protein [Clostridia bacterium]